MSIDETASSVEGEGIPSVRISAQALREFIRQLLRAANMEDDKALSVADVAVEGDLIGHTTHGVSMVPSYLEDLRKGYLNGTGVMDVVNDRGACITWDGRKLPGQWLITRALKEACCRVSDYGIATVSIHNSHHTGALAAYLRKVTDLGLAAIIMSSNPGASRVAPFGGTRPLFTPDPLAAGFPTSGDPVIVDISSSITTTTMTQMLASQGERFPEHWAMTAEGELTDDPAEVVHRGGSLLPLGGALKGHKGYGLALIVELLTQGLSGYGRADAPEGTAQSLFVQVIDPDFFGGREHFLRQSSWIADACRANPPVPGVTAVRIPGDSAANSRRNALSAGVPVATKTVERLCVEADTLDVTVPVEFA